jgi:hypothetical protein
VVATSHRVVVIRYHRLHDHRPYTDLGPESFAPVDRQRLERHHVHRLEQLGYALTLTPAPAA